MLTTSVKLMICTAVTIGTASGCTNLYVAEMDANQVQYEREMQRIQTEHDAAMRKIREESDDCVRRIEALKIGSSELETKSIPCRESRINTTTTESGTFDQWVYELADDKVVYLYYRNGKLTAIQD